MPARRCALFAALSIALCCAALPCQAPPEPQPDALELPLLQTGAKELDAFATLCFKNGFPRRARDLWLEVMSDYDRDDAVAREQLGFVRVGSAWQPKTGFDYPVTDAPNLKNARMLESRWQAACKKLGEGHRDIATQLQAAGKAERAQYHFRRALRFLPTDASAQSGVGAKTVEGVTGTDLELALLRRSRMMDRSVARLSSTPFSVQKGAATDPRLDAAAVKYESYSTENFVIFGDWEPEVLTELAQWCERAHAFCQEAFADGESWKTPPEITTKIAFFRDRATWGQVVKAHAAAIGDVDFVLQFTSACGIDRGKQGIFVSGQQDPAVMTDYAVRKVAEQWSMLKKDAVIEGLGHAVVGMFFGRNLIMTVAEQKKSGTVAGRNEKRFDLPDLEIWRELARDLAFEKASAPAAHLPLILASKFSSEERIKSWSFCDYLLRRDPSLLLALDRAGNDAKNDFDVMTAFTGATKQSLRAVEDDWRSFYTGDSAALRAIREQSTPMEAISKDAPLWLEEFNRLRKQHGAGEVGWSADWSVACRQHADYLKKNKVSRDLENTQDQTKPGFSNQGRVFAQRALVWSGDKEPKKAMANWLLLPGYRDAILDRGLEQIGIFAEGALVVIDVQRGRTMEGRIATGYFPYATQRGPNAPVVTFPSAVPVALLGTEAQQVLEAAGRGKQKDIGLPISIHFFGADQSDVQCEVTSGGKPVEGKLVHSTQGSRRVAAAGMWVFYPLAPLPKGEATVKWTTRGEAESFPFTVGG